MKTTNYELADIRSALNLAMVDERWESVAKYAAQLAKATADMAAQDREANCRGFGMFGTFAPLAR